MTEPPAGPDGSPPGPKENAVRARVRPAATFLLMVSVMNLLAGLYNMVNAIALKQTGPDAAFQKTWDEVDPFLKKMLERGDGPRQVSMQRWATSNSAGAASRHWFRC